MKGQRDPVGWLAAATLSAALMAGAATAAMRAPSSAGPGGTRAIALDLSIGSVSVVAAPPPAPVAAVPPPRMAPPLPAAPSAPTAMSEAILPPQDTAPLTPQPADPQPVPPQPEAKPVPDSPPPDAPVLAAKTLESSPRPEPRRAETAPDPQPEAPAAPGPPAGAEQAAQPAERKQAGGAQETARYADLVMRQVSRQSRRTAEGRGVVVVGLAIGPDGGLDAVRVLQSSGSDRLDRLAADHIRRAAPFPPPPQGETMRFSFEFVVR